MDPLTAIATMITALANAYIETVKSQPPDVQKAMWDIYVSDMKNIRAFFHIGA